MELPILIALGFLFAGLDAWMMTCVRDKLPLGLPILCKGVVIAAILVLLACWR